MVHTTTAASVDAIAPSCALERDRGKKITPLLIKCSIFIGCHVPGVLQSVAKPRMTDRYGFSLTACLLRAIYAYHSSAYCALPHPAVLWVHLAPCKRQPVPRLCIFSVVCSPSVGAAAKCRRSRWSEVPPSGPTRSSMPLLSPSSLKVSFLARDFSPPSHFELAHHLFQRAQRVTHTDNRLHPRFVDSWATQPRNL